MRWTGQIRSNRYLDYFWYAFWHQSRFCWFWHLVPAAGATVAPKRGYGACDY